MLTNYVRHEYKQCRKEHFSPLYGITPNQPTAKACLALAKRRVWVKLNWSDFDDGVATSNDGQWRCRLVPDDDRTLDDIAGDTFDVEMHKDTVPGGKRTIEAQRKEYEEKLAREGIWGYVLERLTTTCNNPKHASWEHVDSCFGFDDVDFVKEEAMEAMYIAKGE